MQRRRRAHGRATTADAVQDGIGHDKSKVLSVATDPILWLVGTIILGVYSQTLYPSIAGGDSGELVAESCHLGVSHPPGYPLFNMLNFIVVNMPGQQTKAWKANLFSAACDTVCCMLMYATIVSWTAQAPSPSLWLTKVAAATAAVTFALSPLIWTYAISAEVFSMNNLFAAWLIFVLLRYAQSGSMNHANLGAFVCGLALCNQHTIVLFEIPIIAWVLWTQRHALRVKMLSKFTFYFTLGLLPYIYMPIVSTWNPQPGSWGDVTSVAGLFHHLRRGDYGTFRLFSSDRDTEPLSTRLVLYLNDAIGRQGGYLLGPLALVGVLNPPRRVRFEGFRWAVVCMYLFYLVVFHALSNMPLSEGLLYGVHMRFWQQPNIVLFVWGGVGLNAVLHRANEASGVLSRLGVVLSIACTVGQGVQWHHVGNQSQAWYIHNYAKALVDPLPRNALVFVNYDLQWTAIRYLQRCEGFRPDVTVLNLSMMTYKWFGTKHALYPSMSFPGDRLVPASNHQDGGFSLRDLVRVNIDKFPGGIYLGGQLNFPDPTFHDHFITVPYGLLDKFHPASKPVYKSLKKWHRQNAKRMAHVRAHLPVVPSNADYNDETWEWTVARDYHMKQLGVATFLLDETIKSDKANITWLAECTRPLEHSLRHEPRQFWSESLLKNLGLAYAYIVRSPDDFAPTDPDPFEPHVGQGVADKAR
ncbi:hypothetical protein, variant 2 [Aphanomyces invadans]|nr:hypothetical protein, variant 2 [Aphanomyces invadans]ETV91286.1 hypothetical protein, variant 2 [Aphanomyces invadans]|eukprot:XP_008880123.1 hypothetical protein, variant 2 [Aphanomyces invadans]